MGDPPLTTADAEEMRKKICKDGVDSQVVCDVLENLLAREVSVQVMLESGLGKTIKIQRKHTDSKVAEVAEKLTAKWKEIVAKEQKKKTTPAKVEAKKEGRGAPTPSTGSIEKREEQKKEEAKKENNKAAPSAKPSDDKRGKVVALFAKALVDPSMPKDEATLQQLAIDIEKVLHEHFKETNDAYTLQAKSIKFNLVDPKNKDFRKLVVTGEIPVYCMPTLNSTQMAGREKIEMKKANWEAATFQDQMFITAKNLGSASDMFECKKCKKKCTFYQKQTRSSDEPMTVFITCKACGHEWRE